MNQALHTSRPFLAAIGSVAATLFTPSHCWAAGETILPWDYTLDVILELPRFDGRCWACG